MGRSRVRKKTRKPPPPKKGAKAIKKRLKELENMYADLQVHEEAIREVKKLEEGASDQPSSD